MAIKEESIKLTEENAELAMQVQMSSKHAEASCLREEVDRLKNICAAQEDSLSECMRQMKLNQIECERLKTIAKQNSECPSTVTSESPESDDKNLKDNSFVIDESDGTDRWDQRLEKKINLMEELELLSQPLPSERQMNIQYFTHLDNMEKELLRLRNKLAKKPVLKGPDKKNALTSYKDHVKRVIDYSFARFK